MDIITFILKSFDDISNIIYSDDIIKMINDNVICVLCDSTRNEISFRILANGEDNRLAMKAICDLVYYHVYYD